MSSLAQVRPADLEFDSLMSMLDLVAGGTPERLLERALQVAARALEATKACVAMYRSPYHKGDEPVWAITVGCGDAGVSGMKDHFSSAIVHRALEGGRAFSVASALGDPRLAANHSVRLGRITSVVCAPLSTRAPAVLCLQNPPRGIYQDDEVERVEALVRRLSPLVERCIVTEDARHAAFRPLVGRSAEWLTTLARADRVARQDVPLLVVGEPGSGRSTIARAVHAASHRSGGPRFEVVGRALTHAHVRDAEGGTLIVESVEQLTDAGRAALLDLFGRSDRQDRPRLIATRARTSVDRDEPSGDLDALLFPAVLAVPSLADRPGDVVALIDALGRRAAERAQHVWLGCASDTTERLRRRRWPGNVAELDQVIVRAVASARGARPLSVDDLDFDVGPAEPGRADAMGELFPDGLVTWKEAKHRFEDWYLQRALQECGGHRAITAARLGMGRATLFEVLKRFGGDDDDDRT